MDVPTIANTNTTNNNRYRRSRPVNEHFRLEKNVIKAFSPEMGRVDGQYTRTKLHPIPLWELLLFAKIQDGRQIWKWNSKTDIKEVVIIIKWHFMCLFQLASWSPLICWHFCCHQISRSRVKLKVNVIFKHSKPYSEPVCIFNSL